jgi:Na+/H+-dicarboxylate symporter
VTFKMIFSEMMAIFLPFLIFSFIVDGIIRLEKNPGRNLFKTVLFSYLSTIGAGFLSGFLALNIIPYLPSGDMLSKPKQMLSDPFFTLNIEPIMSVQAALIMAFVIGWTVHKSKTHYVEVFFKDQKIILESILKTCFMPILPVYIGAIFFEVARSGIALPVIQSFTSVIVLSIIAHWIWLFLLFSVASFGREQTGIQSLKTMIPAYVTAIGTMSSLVTVPVTLAQTIKNGVRESTAGFVIPLCATIHLAGSTITLTTAAIAVMGITQNSFPSWDILTTFIMALGVTMVAAPGIPGGGVMAAIGLFVSMLGFNEIATGLMIAIYTAQDSFGTACNVAGDGAIAMMIDRGDDGCQV